MLAAGFYAFVAEICVHEIRACKYKQKASLLSFISGLINPGNYFNALWSKTYYIQQIYFSAESKHIYDR